MGIIIVKWGCGSYGELYIFGKVKSNFHVLYQAITVFGPDCSSRVLPN